MRVAQMGAKFFLQSSKLVLENSGPCQTRCVQGGATVHDDLKRLTAEEACQRQISQRAATAARRQVLAQRVLQMYFSQLGLTQLDVAGTSFLGQTRTIEADPTTVMTVAAQVPDSLCGVEGLFARF